MNKTILGIEEGDEPFVKMRNKVFHFTNSNIHKLNSLADLRKESLPETLAYIAKNITSRIPNISTQRPLFLEGLDVVETGMDGHLPYIKLANGRIFFDHPSRVKEMNIFYLIRDKLPKVFSPETYFLGLEVLERYQHGANYKGIPGKGGVIVEAGAYVGYKAIAFADKVRPSGKIIAIESMKDNYDLLVKNIKANNLQDIVLPFWCALWDKSGTMEIKGESRQVNTLVDLNGRDYQPICTVPTNTLDNVLSEASVDRVDFLNMQINGAELWALRGLKKFFDLVKIFRIASYYQVKVGDNRMLSAEDVCNELEQRGCQIISGRESGNIFATSKGHVHKLNAAK